MHCFSITLKAGAKMRFLSCLRVGLNFLIPFLFSPEIVRLSSGTTQGTASYQVDIFMNPRTLGCLGI